MGYPQVRVPDTKHSVFYSYSMHVNGIQIGSFQRFSQRSTRTVERIREILFSRGPEVKDMVWGGVDISIDISRVEMYGKAMLEAFGFEIYSLEDFNQVVDITEIQTNPSGWETNNAGISGGQRVITFKDCVPSDMSKDVDLGTVQIAESMTFQCRTIRGRRTS